MCVERKTLSRLQKWKDKKNRKPLLMTGVRQCGKTYIIKEFGLVDVKSYFVNTKLEKEIQK